LIRPSWSIAGLSKSFQRIKTPEHGWNGRSHCGVGPAKAPLLRAHSPQEFPMPRSSTQTGRRKATAAALPLTRANANHNLTGKWHGWFTHFAYEAARLTGKPVAFLTAFTIVIIWAVTGPAFGFSDTWQLVINTGTTIVTFLMVFLIQNTQNRDTLALQIKLAELIVVMQGARNGLATIEDLSDEELEKLHDEYRSRADETLDSLAKRRTAAAKS
jgi:low affinity Fe/Cu permease